MRLADRLGGTWTLLTQVLTAASPPTCLTGTASHNAAPGVDDPLSDHPTMPEVSSMPPELAASLQDAEADSGTLLVLYP
jgi:hypothetical protein